MGDDWKATAAEYCGRAHQLQADLERYEWALQEILEVAAQQRDFSAAYIANVARGALRAEPLASGELRVSDEVARESYEEHVRETVAKHGRHSDTSCPPGSRAMCSYEK